MGSSRFAVPLLALAVASWALPCLAEEGPASAVPAPTSSPAPTVHVTVDGRESAVLVERMLTRLRAELRVSGFVIAPERAGEARAVTDYAEIGVSGHGERVLLDVTTRSPSASSHVVLAGGERELGALALQAVEFLRAGLVPRIVEPEPPDATPPKPGPSEPPRLAPLEPAAGRAYLDIGGTLLTNLGAKDQLALLSLGLGYASAGRVSFGAFGEIPLTSAAFQAGRGAADYQLWLGGLDGDFAFWRSAGGELALGSLLGLARATARGNPTGPARAERPASWSLVLGAKLRAQLKLSPSIALQAEARVLALSPNPIVAVFDDERRLGAPSALVSLGVRVGGH